MLENLIVLIVIAYLLKTTTRRCYIGWLVFSYYAIFFIVLVEMLGFQFSHYIDSLLYAHWYLFMISMSLSFALLATYLCYLGCKLCGIYAAWLIAVNCPIILLKLVYPTGANTIDLLYNGIQYLNLGVDLLVVVLGTDNILHRTRYVDTFINNCNNRIDRLCFFGANSRNKDNEK